METVTTTSPSEAAGFIRRGGLAAFPTETVYGLGADVFQPSAVEAIFEAKGRPADNPLIVHLAHRDQLSEVVATCPSTAETLLDRFTPGPLTLILPKVATLPSTVTAGLETVGIRIPRHETARAFLQVCGTPVAAPSANRSGRPSPTSWFAVEEDLGGRIGCILKGGRTEAGVESTVLDCTTHPPTVLRPGAVSVEQLTEAVGRVDVREKEAPGGPRSPGTQHQHYAPSAQVRVVQAPSEAEEGDTAGYIGLDSPGHPASFRKVHPVPDVEAYARDLFHFFRECDRLGCSVIFAQSVPAEGLGRALNDRLERAAAR